MIQLFEVENFKGFKNKISFNFKARDYSYNNDLIKDGLVNKALIYGKNGTGKTNLTIALFDITAHLTDKQRMPAIAMQNYRNLDSDNPLVKFHYIFKFNNDILDYKYTKTSIDSLYKEELTLNNQLLIKFNYENKENNYIAKEVSGDLNMDLVNDNKLSVIKYVYRNRPTNSVPIITKLISFCEHMLWFRSLSDGNSYAGLKNGSNSLSEVLYNSGKLEDFKRFLQGNGLNYHLKFKTYNDEHRLYVEYSHGEAPVEAMFSSGTRALYLFYVWSLSFDDISFLAIDEFDAFYHYESAECIVKALNRNNKFQSVLTTHNTYLMQNKLTRPDCCYLLTNQKLSCLSNCTAKEIRQAHNLEKMYINGAFTDGN